MQSKMNAPEPPRTEASQIAARRRFLATCGKFAIATPPAVALLLSQSERSYATAGSGGHGGHKGGHHHGRGRGRGRGWWWWGW